jgi:tubulin--tyrosine ligase
MEGLSISARSTPRFSAVIDYEEPYVQPLILAALASRLPKDSYDLVSSTSQTSSSTPVLHIRSYEQLPFEDIVSQPDKCLGNAYIIRKALIRKHYLTTTSHNWITKNPTSVLKSHVKPSCDFELDYAEFLDDALVEAWDLQASFQKNENEELADREWWILKPGMSDRGQGIRLFSTQDELQSIFDEWEAERPDSDDEEEDDGEAQEQASGDYIMTSQLRHFVAQPYIHAPLLLPNNPRKFHIRTYVVAVGSLKVYVYRSMLALFAATPYTAPWASSATSPIDLSAHLTNTCLQDGTREGSVLSFWDLPSTLPLSSSSTGSSTVPTDWREDVFSQICGVTGEIFEAAARGMMVHFQTLPNAFEVFGLDFLVDAEGTAWLLEVNAFPDFKQTGDDLKAVVEGLWEGVVDVAVAPFFGVQQDVETGEKNRDMVLVRELDLGRK